VLIEFKSAGLRKAPYTREREYELSSTVLRGKSAVTEAIAGNR
jgi:hypothetical protein